MFEFLHKLRSPHIRRRILIERLAEPLHVNIASAFVGLAGSFRARVSHDLVIRPHNAYGILQAGDQAARMGLEAVSLLEFGVAAGAGLTNMARIAAQVTRLTGVSFRIYGFDTGAGMPPPHDFRDHPDLYGAGDFPMDSTALRSILPANTSLIIGDVSATVPEFLARIDDVAPIGYVVFDLDYYSSTREALAVLTAADPAKYLPLTYGYFDDMHEQAHNRWCGELLAVEEFNATQPMRKIERDRFLADRRIYRRADWIKQMFSIHVLDHPLRNQAGRKERVVLENPYLRG
jgi:hypothetical protein